MTEQQTKKQEVTLLSDSDRMETKKTKTLELDLLFQDLFKMHGPLFIY